MRNFYAFTLVICALFANNLQAQSGWNFYSTGTTENLNDIASSYSAGLVLVAVGENGTIIRSTDNGMNWTVSTSGTVEHLNDVYYDGEMTTYMVVGNNGTVLFSTDQGISWTAATTTPAGDLFAVQGTYGSTWYAAGVDMKLYRTTNSGADWSLWITAEGTGNLSSLAIDDYTGNLYVAGQGGYLAEWMGEGWIDYSVSGGEDITALYPDYGGFYITTSQSPFYYLETMVPQKTSATETIYNTGYATGINALSSNGESSPISVGDGGTVYDLGSFNQNNQPARKQFKSTSNLNGVLIDGATAHAVGDGGLFATSNSWQNCEYGVVYSTAKNPTCFGGADGAVIIDSLSGWSSFSYLWSTGATADSIINQSAGVYQVTMTSDLQCTEEFVVTLTDPEKITVDAGLDQSICYGSMADLSATGGDTYVWSPAASITDPNIANPKANPTDTTTYYVTVTDGNGCSNVDSITINIIPAPVYSMQQYYDICSDDTVQVSLTGGDEFIWDTQEEMSDSTVAQPNLFPLYNRTYYVTITETATGCTATDMADVYVNQRPQIDLVDDTICQGGSALVIAEEMQLGKTTFQGYYEYTWSTGESATQITVTTAGEYSVVGYSPEIGCPSYDTMNLVVIDPKPLLQDTTFCESNPVTLDPGSFAAYVWNTGATTSTIITSGSGEYIVTVQEWECSAQDTAVTTANYQPNASIPDSEICGDGDAYAYIETSSDKLWSTGETSGTALLGASGVYSLTVTEGYCSDVDSMTFTRHEDVILDVQNDTVCEGIFGMLDAGPGYVSYDWQFSGTDQKLTIGAGSYNLTVVDTNGCQGQTSAQVVEVPYPSFDLGNGATICEQDDHVIVGPEGSFTYLWSDGSLTKDLLVTTGGDYSLTITDQYGCSDQDTVSILANPLPVVSLTDVDVCEGTVLTLDAGAGHSSQSWSTLETTQTIDVTTAGTYSVTVANEFNCFALDSMILGLITPELGVMKDTAVCADLSVEICAGNFASYLWFDGRTDKHIDVPATGNGTFLVTVTDMNDCEVSGYVSLMVSPKLGLEIDTIDVTCAGIANGQAMAILTGGTAPFGYSWSNGGSTVSINNLLAGPYQVTATDSIGCGVSGSVIVKEPQPLSFIKSSVAAVCAADNGSASVTTLGGVPEYNYSWSNGTTSQSITDVAAGTYYVTVVDANNCVYQDSVAVSQSDSTLALSLNADPTVCSAVSGTAEAATFGGIEPYSYSWSTSDQTASVSGLGAGVYSVTVVDGNSCETNGTVTVGQSDLVVTVSTQTVNAICTNANGEVSAAAAGGTLPYQYNWSNQAATANLSNLAPGVYQVTVVDANGCTGSGQDTVGVAQEQLAVAISSISTMCDGLHGSVMIAVTGGTETYTYDWSTGSTAAGLANVGTGVYSVSATDSNGCVGINSIAVDNEKEGINMALSTSNSSCGQADGTVTAVVTGTTGTVSYNWSNGGSNSAENTAVTSGTYTLVVVDSLGCTDSARTVVNDLDGPIVVLDTAIGAECSQPDGAIQISAEGGTGALTFAWSNGDDTADIDGLAPGVYSVEVSDVNGCKGGLSATVSTNGSVAPVVQGTVVSSLTGDPLNEGKVTMIQFSTSPGTLPKFVSTEVDENGFFQFDEVWVDNYIVLVRPDTSFFPNAFKTFFPNVPRWDSAQVVTTSCADTTQLAITVRQFFAMNGLGKIRGQILRQLKTLLLKNGSVTGDPIPGINVSLEQVPGGVVAQTETDEDGLYLFDNVPAGDYQIFVDIPGLPMDSTYKITIADSDQDTSVVDLDFLVDTTSSVYIQDVTDAVHELQTINARIEAYPNPFQSSFDLRLETAEPASEVVIALRDVTGRIVAQQQFISRTQQTVRFEQLDAFGAGLWLIQGTVDGVGFTIPIMKMK